MKKLMNYLILISISLLPLLTFAEDVKKFSPREISYLSHDELSSGNPDTIFECFLAATAYNAFPKMYVTKNPKEALRAIQSATVFESDRTIKWCRVIEMR